MTLRGRYTPINYQTLAGNISLGDLSDITITSAADNDILQWNGSAWENRGDLTMGTGNQIFLDLGSVSAPALAFSGDINTGIYGSISGGELSFAVDGAQAIGFTATRATLYGDLLFSGGGDIGGASSNPTDGYFDGDLDVAGHMTLGPDGGSPSDGSILFIKEVRTGSNDIKGSSYTLDIDHSSVTVANTTAQFNNIRVARNNSPTGGTITECIGVNSLISARWTGNTAITTGYLFRGGLNTDLAGYTGVMSDIRGLYLTGIDDTLTSGTITNAYGVFIDDIKSSTYPALSYAIKTGTGAVDFGDTLDVMGVTTLASNLLFSGNGDIGDGGANNPTDGYFDGTVTADIFDAVNGGEYHIDGNEAFTFPFSSANISIGLDAGRDQSGAATSNVFVGKEAGRYCSTGIRNMGLGTGALKSDVTNRLTGSSNVGIGWTALFDVTTGGDNMGIGSGSLSGVTTSSNNVGIGTSTLQTITTSSTSAGNVGIGFSVAPTMTAGFYNTFIGYRAGYLKQSGNFNIFIGKAAGLRHTTEASTFIIDRGLASGSPRATKQNEIDNSILYGEMADAAVNQTLAINAATTITQTLNVTGVTTLSNALIVAAEDEVGTDTLDTTNQYVSVDTSGGARVITLPALSAANHGTIYRICDGDSNAFTNNITISPNASDGIQGGGDNVDLILSANDDSVTLIANNDAGQWEII